MKSFNDKVYAILSGAEPNGLLGSSVTANKIIDAARSEYAGATESERKEIIDKIESLKSQPGVPFPPNYESLIAD